MWKALIDYVEKHRESGVVGGFNLINAVITGFGNNSVCIKTNHKLSEFNFNYHMSYRDYDDRFMHEDQSFWFPEGNRARYLKKLLYYSIIPTIILD